MSIISEEQEMEWRAQRCGCLTASKAVDVCQRGKKGQKLQAYTNYQAQLVAERLTGIVESIKPSAAMIWGTEHEDEAARAYEEQTGTMVSGDGKTFIKSTFNDFFGASPDRFVGEDGLLEIKCPNSLTHLERLKSKQIPEEYLWQIRVQLLITGRKWCDFVDYDPRFPKHLQLLIVRYEPTKEELEQTKALCEEFLDETANVLNDINSMKLGV